MGTAEDDCAPRPDLGSRFELVDEATVAHAEEHQVGDFVDRRK